MESDNFDQNPSSSFPETPLSVSVEALTPPPVVEPSFGHNALDNIDQSEEDFTTMLAFPSIDEISDERVSELRNARGRRRASSFDVSMPVPRIKLRPRFSGKQSQLLYAPEFHSGSRMSEHGQKVVTSSSQTPSHFRSYTYDTGFSYSNVFAEAVAAESAEKGVNNDLSLPLVHSPPLDVFSLERDLPEPLSLCDHTQTLLGFARPNPRHHRRSNRNSITPHSSLKDHSSVGDTTSSAHSQATSTLSTSDTSAFEITGIKHLRCTPRKRYEDDSVESSLVGFPYLESDGNAECKEGRNADSMV